MTLQVRKSYPGLGVGSWELGSRLGVAHGYEPAEVAVAGPRLAQERQVVAVVQRQLGAGDRLDAETGARLCVLHGSVEAVMIGLRERRVAALGGRRSHLRRM